jgi:hypothetical protein
MIEFNCPGCGKSLKVPEDKAGKAGKCSKCGAYVVVPLRFAEEITPLLSDDSFVIGKDTPLPLTIVGVSEVVVKDLVARMDGIHPTNSFVGGFVAQTGLRCKEIDDLVELCRPQYAAAFARFKADLNAELPEVPEACGLDAYPYFDIAPLFSADSFPVDVGRELVGKYGFENLISWCNQWDRAPRPVPDGHPHRPRCDELVKVGLATWGPPITKRGKTGPAFTIVKIPELPTATGLYAWIHRCQTIGELIHHTFLMDLFAEKRAAAEKDPAILEILKAVEISTAGDNRVCPCCRRMAGKKFPPSEGPRPPFHLGCRCGTIEDLR